MVLEGTAKLIFMDLTKNYNFGIYKKIYYINFGPYLFTRILYKNKVIWNKGYDAEVNSIKQVRDKALLDRLETELIDDIYF